MDELEAQFERQLREGLKCLADGAPGGAGVEGVRRRLRRRAVRRAASGAVGAAVMVLLAVRLVPLERGIVPQPTPVVMPPPSFVQAPLPEPIPADASPRTIEEALRQCLAQAGVTGDAWVAKDPDRGLSLAVSGEDALPPETLQAQLGRLLANFETLEIALRDGQLQYRLFASRQDWASVSAQG